MKYNIIEFLVILSLLTSCSNSSSRQVEGTGEQDNKSLNSGDNSTLQRKKKKENIVRRPVATLKDFSYITNLGSVNIVYTQGDYSIEVEGDSAMLQYLTTSFDSNLLTVSMRTDGNRDFNLYGNTSNVTMYISCPDLKCVSICGNGGFESRGTWSADDLQVGVLGTGTMSLDAIECNTFSMQSTSISLVSIANLKANEATVMTRTSAIIDMNVDVEELIVLNDGKPKITLTGKAANLLIKNPKDETLVNNIKD